MADILPVNSIVTAKVHPCHSVEEALQNCLSYNPGYPFQDCVVTVEMQGAPQDEVKMKYCKDIPLSSMMVPQVLRSWYSIYIDQLVRLRVAQKPETLRFVTLKFEPMNANPPPPVDLVKDLCHGLHLSPNRIFYIKHNGVLFKVNPLILNAPFQGIFDKEVTEVSLM